MRTRGRVRTEWRLEVYRAALETCRAEQTPLGRLVAPSLDGLRLPPGDPVQDSVPVWIDPALRGAMAEAFTDLDAVLAPGQSPEAPLAGDEAAKGPALELALLDGRLEPRRLAGWLSRHGLRLHAALEATLVKAFAEVGRSDLGEERSLVALLAVEQALSAGASAIAQRPGSPAPALALALLERATRAAAEHPDVDQKAVGRASLRAALLQSHYSFQRSIPALLATELNPYRTSALAVLAARALLRSEAALHGIDEALGQIAVAVVTDPEAGERAWVEAAMELLREALAEPWLTISLPTPLEELLSAALSEPPLLREMITDRAERDKLGNALSKITPAQPFMPALDLLRRIAVARRRKQGDPLTALAEDGDVPALALDLARGAYLMAADSAVRKLLAPLEASLQQTDDRTAHAEWRQGLRYRFGPGPEPPLQGAGEASQAQLAVDLRDLARRALRVQQGAAGHFLRTELYDPLLAEAARLRESAGGGDDSLSVVRVGGEGLAFRGEARALVELGIFTLRQLARVKERLDSSLPEGLAAQDLQSLREKELLRRQLAEEKRELEGKLSRARLDPEQVLDLEERLRQASNNEREASEALRLRREALFGGALEASIFVSHGPVPTTLQLANPALGHFPVALGEALDEAALGCARAPVLRELRDSWSVQARGLPPAFAVVLASSAPLEVPRDALYNGGFAISGQALAALREGSGASFQFLDKQLAPGQISAALRAQLCFPPDEPLELVLELRRDDRRLRAVFRKAGELRLGGASRAGSIWELCDPDGPFTRLLATHHLRRWIA